MTLGSEVLKVVTARLLQQGKSQIELRKSFKAFTKLYISSKDKQCRTTELKKYFDLLGELIIFFVAPSYNGTSE